MNTNVHFFSWDERRDIAHPGNREETILFCAEHCFNCAKEAIKNHGFFALALSGGSTPKAIYKLLSNPPYSTEIDWSRVFLFWSDERSVPPTHSESNFWMAMEAGFKAMPIPTPQIFRMEAETDIERHAEEYEETIKKTLGNRPFDLIMLGVGEDGHTASLFPNTDALKEDKRLVVANEVTQKKTSRMTLTYPCINRAINLVFYALGKEKSQIIGDIFLKKQDPSLPASLVGAEGNKALWIVDDDAGKLLLEKRKAQ